MDAIEELSINLLLEEVEALTGQEFLVADDFEQFEVVFRRDRQEAPKYGFSNRPWPSTTWRRDSATLPTLSDYRFHRLDLELADHSIIPTQAEKQEALDYAMANGASAGAMTKHGVHVYLIYSEPVHSVNLKPLTHHFMRNYVGPFKACSASWSCNNWSRWYPLAFYTPGLSIQPQFTLMPPIGVNPPRLKVNSPKGKRITAAQADVEHRGQSFKSSEPAKLAMFLHARDMIEEGYGCDVIAQKLGTSSRHVQEIKARHAEFLGQIGWNVADNAVVSVSLWAGNRCSPKRKLWRRRTLNTDRWFCYEDIFDTCFIGQRPTVAEVKERAKTGRELETHRMKLMENYQFETEEDLFEFIDADIDHHQARYGNGMPEVASQTLRDVESVVVNMAFPTFSSTTLAPILNLHPTHVVHALKMLSYVAHNGQKGRGAGWIFKAEEAPSLASVANFQEVIKRATARQKRRDLEKAEREKLLSKPEIPGFELEPERAVIPDWQCELIDMIKTMDITIKLGPGGTGKTFDEELRLTTESRRGIRVVAPRHTIVMDLSKRLGNVTTIHTAFQIFKGMCSEKEQADPNFQADWNNFKDFKIPQIREVIWDEFSMTDTRTLWAALKRCEPGTKFLLLGDSLQLGPSHATGESALRDVVEMANYLPNIKLVDYENNPIYRIDQGKTDGPSTSLEKANRDLRLGKIPENGPAFTIVRVPNELSNRIHRIAADKLIHAREATGLPWRGVNIMKGEEFGAQLQAGYVKDNRFSYEIGDQVRIGKLSQDPARDRRRGLTKGMTGTVVDVQGETIHVKVNEVEALLIKRIERKLAKKAKDKKKMPALESDQPELTMELGSTADRIKMSLCDKCEKKSVFQFTKTQLERTEVLHVDSVQGWQSDFVLVCLEKCKGANLEAIITAVSRARKACVVVATEMALDLCMNRRYPYQRALWAEKIIYDFNHPQKKEVIYV